MYAVPSVMPVVFGIQALFFGKCTFGQGPGGQMYPFRAGQRPVPEQVYAFRERAR